jgi:hypothetical protein
MDHFKLSSDCLKNSNFLCENNPLRCQTQLKRKVAIREGRFGMFCVCLINGKLYPICHTGMTNSRAVIIRSHR